jgi:hypothetical protein
MSLGRENPAAWDARTVAALVVLNLAVHFVPFARPGFQPDDFTFLHLARIEPAGSFVDTSLAQATRPLGVLLFILLPHWLGLSEPAQLAILISTTTLLTVLVSLLLSEHLPRPLAQLSGLAFVLWPVKHEIYASQLFGVNNLAAALIVGAALSYRRYLKTAAAPALAIAVTCYGLSVFIYELGYLAPLVFVAIERPQPRRLLGAAWFLLPATAYWVFRFIHQDVVAVGGGHYPLKAETFALNLVSSLPSNLVGFQVARNVVYGLWGVVMAPLWFKAWCLLMAVFVAFWIARPLREAGQTTDMTMAFRARVFLGFLTAALLLAPAAMNLIESRHSALAAVGMGVIVALGCARLGATLGTAVLLTLLLAAQGLASRQAEVSRLQASVREFVRQESEEIRSASSVVVDMASLASRLSYTFRPHDGNVLRGYWGMQAFTAGGFRHMVEDALYVGAATPRPLVKTCALGLLVLPQSILCARDFASPESFELPRQGALILDFKTMPLP